MFHKDLVEQFYNEYGEREWVRLDSSAYHKLIYLLHTEFLAPFIGKGKQVLDAGCGGGRFSIYIAQSGSEVTLLDLSNTQLKIAIEKCNEAGVRANIKGAVHESVTDMHSIADNTYDTTLCYGAVLNYLHEGAEKAVSELIRVTKSGGQIILSVNNRFGILRACATEMKGSPCNFWGKPEVWGIKEVLTTGNEKKYPGATHPSRHFYTVDEMKTLLARKELSDIKFAAAPAIFTGARSNVETIYSDKTAWETLLSVEKAAFLNDASLDCGEFLLASMAVTKERSNKV